MTRENKLAIIIGFSLILVVAILITDHLSPAQSDEIAQLDPLHRNQSSLSLRTSLPSGRDSQSPRGNASNQNPSIPQYTSNNTNTSPFTPNRRPATEPRRRIIDLQPAHEAAQTETIEMGVPVNAADNLDPNPAENQNVHLHVVRAGDTLYGLAREYYGNPSFARPLGEFNRDRVMANMQIRKGVTLRIPDRAVLLGESSTPTVQTNDQPRSKTTPRNPALKFKTYKIKSGDTLTEISLTLLGTSKRWREIFDLNKNIIPDPDSLPAGKSIRIPAQ